HRLRPRSAPIPAAGRVTRVTDGVFVTHLRWGWCGRGGGSSGRSFAGAAGGKQKEARMAARHLIRGGARRNVGEAGEGGDQAAPGAVGAGGGAARDRGPRGR